MKAGEDDGDEPTGVVASAPPASAVAAPQADPVDDAPAAETPAVAAPASAFETVAELMPDLSVKQAKAVAEIVKTTRLNPQDALVLARAKNTDLWPAAPATARSAPNTTPTRTGPAPVKREPTPREAASQEYDRCRAGLVTAGSDNERLDFAAATLRARRALQGNN